jgi:1-acyl-sn-glycerol-3-phosphate acyltransferase
MNVLRSLIFWLWFNGSILVVGTLGAPLVFLSKTGGSTVMAAWAQVAAFGARWICGIKTEVRGLENLPEGPVLIASKHQSAFDTVAPILFTARPVYVLKQELLDMPIFGWYCQRAGLIAIDRGGQMAALKKMIAQAKERFADGRPLIIFPEGTRQDIGAQPDYKSGVAGIYTLLGVPCVPMALNTGLVWPAKGFMRYPGTAVFEFLPMIPAGLKRAEFMAILEERIETATNSLVQCGQPQTRFAATKRDADGGDTGANSQGSASDNSPNSTFNWGDYSRPNQSEKNHSDRSDHWGDSDGGGDGGGGGGD